MDATYRFLSKEGNKSDSPEEYILFKRKAIQIQRLCDEFAVSAVGLLLQRNNREGLLKLFCCL